MSGNQQLEFGVLPPHAQSDLAARIAQVPNGPTAQQRPAGPSPATPTERTIAEVEPPAPAAQPPALPARLIPARYQQVAPGGDEEVPWDDAGAANSEPDPTGPSTPLMTLVVSNPTHTPTAPALNEIRSELAEMDEAGITARPPLPPGGPEQFPPPMAAGPPAADPEVLASAVRAGRTADSASAASHGDQAGDAASSSRYASPDRGTPGLPTASGGPVAEAPAGPVHPPGDATQDPDPQPPADDFGPLVAPAHRSPRRRSPGAASTVTSPTPPSGSSRRRVLAAITLGLACCVGLVVGGLALTGSGDGGAPTAAATSGSIADPAQPAPVSMRDWRGIGLPVSAEAGPAVWDGDRVAGFAQSELGAAIAAAHLSVRVDPAVGQDVWGPVLAEQVVGDRDRLEAALKAQTADATADPGQPGTLSGWRVEGDPTAGPVVAHLAVEGADGATADYAIPLAWADGDWALNIPASGAFFPVGDTSGAYAPFEGGR
jgi:hypothetical protein